MGPTELLLDHYAEEYASRAAAARQLITAGTSPEDVESELRAAAQMLEQMEVEALATDAQARPMALERLSTLRKELGGLQTQARKIRRSTDMHVIAMDSPEITSAKGAHGEAGNSDAHTRLLAEYDHVQRTDASLDRVQRMMAESEGAAASVLEDMRRQTEQIERAQRTLGDTEADVDRTNQMLRTMLRRLFAGRLISVAIVACLFVCCLLVIYWKFFT